MDVTIDRVLELALQYDVLGTLTEKKRVFLDLETLAIDPQASVVSVAIVSLGYIHTEYERLQQSVMVMLGQFVSDPQKEWEAPLKTSILYDEWGEHARDMALRKKCVATRDTLDWWGRLPPEAQGAFYSRDSDWGQSMVHMSAALNEADEVWIQHPQFDMPIWEHWCFQHMLPGGIKYRSVRDSATLFPMNPEPPRIRPDIPHHALSDALAAGYQIELALLIQAIKNKLFSTVYPFSA